MTPYEAALRDGWDVQPPAYEVPMVRIGHRAAGSAPEGPGSAWNTLDLARDYARCADLLTEAARKLRDRLESVNANGLREGDREYLHTCLDALTEARHEVDVRYADLLTATEDLLR